MGKFDGILICSDWDGTLFTEGIIPERSAEAIRYFQREGGLFTVCSGRNPEFLAERAHLLKPNTYALCYNGALICNIETGEVLRRNFVGGEAFDAINTVMRSGINVTRVNIFKDNEILHVPADEYIAREAELRHINAYKLTINLEDDKSGERAREIMNASGLSEHRAVRSFYPYCEILRRDSMKGPSAQLLKKITGARVLVGLGDFENDLDLIECADIGYAVENAIDSLKNVADRVTKSVDECAVAHVIEDLEHEFA